MSLLNWPVKDPDEVLDYQIDWSRRLAGDTISESVWAVPNGIVSPDDDFTPTTATVWLSGGTVGATYVLTNHITTAGGRKMDQSVKLKIKEK